MSGRNGNAPDNDLIESAMEWAAWDAVDGVRNRLAALKDAPSADVVLEAMREVNARLGHGVPDEELVALAEEALSVKTGKRLLVNRADLRKSKPPKFAWKWRIVLANLNLLIGMEGVGKGTLVAWMLAMWTRGKLPGDLHGLAINVGVICDEDSWDDVWTPRLEAAGADLDRVFQIEHPEGGFIALGADRHQLTAVIREHEISVLVLDSLLDNLGVGVNDWGAKAVREALQPGRAIARETGVAVLGLMHPRKAGGTFREIVQGSHAFNAVSRSSLLLAEDPDNEGECVLVRGKGNLSQTPSAVQFDIVAHTFKAHGRTFNVPLAKNFADGGHITANDLIAAQTRPKDEHTKIGAVEELLTELLPSDGDWHPAKPIYAAAARAEFGERIVRRARGDLGIEVKRDDKFQGRMLWRWPIPDTPHRTHKNSVRNVRSVRNAKSRKTTIPDIPAITDTPDTTTKASRNAKRGSDK